MSAPATASAAIFSPPLCDWEPEQLLRYYQSRSTVRYFPVADESEVRRDTIDAILAGGFEFNGECHQLPAAFDWLHNPSRDLEWLIQFHKFYYATGLGMAYDETGDERYAAKWVELTSSWIDAVPPGFLPADVTGRRIQNWICAHYYFVTLHAPACVTPEFYARFLASLHEQVLHLREHLAPARNHRTLELWALFLAAVVFPEFQGAGELLEFARAELLRNMETDLLPDGVQCELSFDYHHIVLRNYLAARRLAALNGIAMPPRMDECIRKALEFSLHAHNPAGVVPAFSDGDRGSFLSLLEQGHELYGCEELLYGATRGRRGRPPARTSVAFPASGYLILRSGWGRDRAYEDELHLVLDCGPLGAGNHGHLDLLSFEAAAYGRSLVVDPGRYTYDESGEENQRALFRGTAYHNTVLVDGRNQTRYEPHKRKHKRKWRIRGPEPERELVSFATGADFDYVHAAARSHQYPVTHERRILFARPEYWVICDRLLAGEAHRYDLLFHLSDEAFGRTAIGRRGGTVLVEAPGLVLAQPFDAGIMLAVEEGWVSPRYGVKHPAPVVRFTREAATATFYTVLYPYAAGRPEVAMEALDGGVRVRVNGRADDVLFGAGSASMERRECQQ